MKITRSQKICLSILGVCVTGLIIDQSTGSDVHSVTKASGNASAPVSSKSAVASLPATDAAASDGDVSARLNQLKLLQSRSPTVRDAFAIPIGFDRDSASTGTAGDARVLRFQANHHLKMLLEQGKKSAAIVDNRLVKVGQTIDGFQLKLVDNLKAVFADGELHAVLSIATPDNTLSDNPQ